MLFLAAAALVMPAIFELVEGKGLPIPTAEIVNYGSTVEDLSLAVAMVLIGTYVAGLWFSLRTHKRPLQPAVRRGARGGLRLERAPLGEHVARRRDRRRR